jgi:hypothetical protein
VKDGRVAAPITSAPKALLGAFKRKRYEIVNQPGSAGYKGFCALAFHQSSSATRRVIASSITTCATRSTLRAFRAAKSSIRILFTRATP